MADLCPGMCIECCCCCCCFLKAQKKKKYPHVEYYHPDKAKEVLDMPEFSEVPLHKIFDFPQEARPFPVHPQVSPRSSPRPSPRGSPQPPSTRRRGESAPVVTSQPRATPQYLSELSKARSLPEADLEMGIIDMSGRDHNLDPPFSPIQEESVELETAQVPKIRFSLYYDIQRSVLSVHLMDAENIPVKGSFKSVDPFVVMFLLPAREVIHQSKIIKSSQNPHFNQVFEFKDVSSDMQQQILVLQVFDRDRASKDDLIGTVLAPLNEADLFGILTIMKIDIGTGALKTHSSGDLLLSLKLRPRHNTLSGIILKAANLPRPHIWGLADPYVKIYMVHKNKRVNKWKSTVKKNTLAPVFNETFEFSTANMDIKDIQLELFMMDRDKFTRNDVMGMIIIGLGSHSESGKSHWSMMMSSPQQSISHWHNLLPREHLARKKRQRHRSQSL